MPSFVESGSQSTRKGYKSRWAISHMTSTYARTHLRTRRHRTPSSRSTAFLFSRSLCPPDIFSTTLSCLSPGRTQGELTCIWSPARARHHTTLVPHWSTWWFNGAPSCCLPGSPREEMFGITGRKFGAVSAVPVPATTLPRKRLLFPGVGGPVFLHSKLPSHVLGSLHALVSSAFGQDLPRSWGSPQDPSFSRKKDVG